MSRVLAAAPNSIQLSERPDFLKSHRPDAHEGRVIRLAQKSKNKSKSSSSSKSGKSSSSSKSGKSSSTSKSGKGSSSPVQKNKSSSSTSGKKFNTSKKKKNAAPKKPVITNKGSKPVQKNAPVLTSPVKGGAAPGKVTIPTIPGKGGTIPGKGGTIPGKGGTLPGKVVIPTIPTIPTIPGIPGGKAPTEPTPPVMPAPAPGSVLCQKNPTAPGCLGGGTGVQIPGKCKLQPFLPECRPATPPGKTPPHEPEQDPITGGDYNAGNCAGANYDAARCSAFCKYNPNDAACGPTVPELPPIENPPIDFPPPICVQNPHLPICNPRPYDPPYDSPVIVIPPVDGGTGVIVQPAPRRAAKRSGRVAVVVDIGEYSFKRIPNMPLARQNAAAVVDFLRSDLGLSSDRILELSNPRLSNLVEVFQKRNTPARQLHDLLVRFNPAEVIVYITGHGFALNGTDDALLLPVDADPNDVLTSSYRLSSLFNALLGHEIRQLQLYLETSFNPQLGAVPGPGFGKPGAVRLVPDLAAKEKWRVRYWVTFAAAEGDGPTLDPERGPVSAFTQSVLQGLKGSADRTGNGNKDGKVNAGELIDFTRSQLGQILKPLGGTQTPQLNGPRRQFLHRYRISARPPASAPGVKPSFNCAKARSNTEKAICASPAIATLDTAMAGLFRKKYRARKGSVRRALVAKQNKWLRKRNACGSDIACLTQRYIGRIQQLQ